MVMGARPIPGSRLISPLFDQCQFDALLDFPCCESRDINARSLSSLQIFLLLWIHSCSRCTT